MDSIREFRGEYAFLSNFYPCGSIVRYSFQFPTLEHAFQCEKTENPYWRRLILSAATAGEAKRRGRRAPLRPDWEETKDLVMYGLVGEKFRTQPLGRLLLETGDADLFEGNNWRDTYWGVDLETGEGRNELGRILMAVREELRG